MPTSIHKLVNVSPNVWPGKALESQPGDFKLFVPQGLGLAGPMPMMPWDDLSDVMNRQNYYGFEPRHNHPILDAPRTGATGGTIYLDDDPTRPDLDALLRLLRVRAANKQYAVFVSEAEDTLREGYLTQLRLMSTWALCGLFGAVTAAEREALPEQPLTLGELIWKFFEDQRAAYGSGFSHKLSGCMGGDGDWAKESLAFGFMVENEYHGVYRLWSRAWLVTK